MTTTTTEKAFELAKLTHDKEHWLRELERCPPHEPFLRAYIERSLEETDRELKELVDA